VNRDELSTAYAQTGPKNWVRVRASDLAKAQPRVVTPTQVSNVVSTVDKISFDVAEIGKPVEVKESYFPNWKISGASGPYRLAPNLMVVVPTSRHVELTYGLTAADWLGRGISVAGVGGLVALGMWSGARRFAAGTDEAPQTSDDPDGNGGAPTASDWQTAPADDGLRDDGRQDDHRLHGDDRPEDDASDEEPSDPRGDPPPDPPDGVPPDGSAPAPALP
jgi:hypothetical protein